MKIGFRVQITFPHKGKYRSIIKILQIHHGGLFPRDPKGEHQRCLAESLNIVPSNFQKI